MHLITYFCSREGYIELIHFTLSGDQPNDNIYQYIYLDKQFDSHIRHEKIAQHDCFYKNMYDYRYIAVIDPDEVIVPQTDTTLPALLDRLTLNNDVWSYGAIKFNHSYMFDDFNPRPLADDEFIPK